jgi:hypothetical protein
MSGRLSWLIALVCVPVHFLFTGDRASAQCPPPCCPPCTAAKPTIVFDAKGTTDEKFTAGFGFTMKNLGKKVLANNNVLSALTIDGMDVKDIATPTVNQGKQSVGIALTNICGYVLRAGKHTVKVTVVLDNGDKVSGEGVIDFQKIQCFSSPSDWLGEFPPLIILVSGNGESCAQLSNRYAVRFATGSIARNEIA